MTDPDTSPNRREESIERTRADALVAARELFVANGYERTTVREIARRARMSPATVYAQCGGKEGLLGSLMDLWTTDELIPQIIEQCAAAPTGRATIDVLGRGYMRVFGDSGDIALVVSGASTSVPAARDFLRLADERHLAALTQIVKEIEQKGDLAPDVTVEDAARIVFFHFRAEQIQLAVTTFGWGEERARVWIADRVAAAILADDTP